VAEGPDLRLGIGLTHERIVGWDGSVVAETQYLPLVRIGPLGDRIVRPAHHHVQISVGSEYHRRPGWRPGARSVSDEELLDVNEGHAFETTTHESGRVALLAESLDVAQIDETVLGEPRMQHDLHQAAETGAVDNRDT
jgi:hypothetical protein